MRKYETRIRRARCEGDAREATGRDAEEEGKSRDFRGPAHRRGPLLGLLERDEEPGQHTDEADACEKEGEEVNAFLPSMARRRNSPVHAAKATALELAKTMPAEHSPPRKAKKTAKIRWSRDLTYLATNSLGSLTSSTQTVVKTRLTPNAVFRRCVRKAASASPPCMPLTTNTHLCNNALNRGRSSVQRARKSRGARDRDEGENRGSA